MLPAIISNHLLPQLAWRLGPDILTTYPDGSTILHRCAKLLGEQRHPTAGDCIQRLLARGRTQAARPQDFIAKEQTPRNAAQGKGPAGEQGKGLAVAGKEAGRGAEKEGEAGPSTSGGSMGEVGKGWTNPRWAAVVVMGGGGIRELGPGLSVRVWGIQDSG